MAKPAYGKEYVGECSVKSGVALYVGSYFVRWRFTLYGGGLLPPQGVQKSSKADGLIPSFAGTRAHPNGAFTSSSRAKRGDLSLKPIRTLRFISYGGGSYGGGLLPPQGA